jgi:transcriptional regulator with XRE-family HTH domain
VASGTSVKLGKRIRDLRRKRGWRQIDLEKGKREAGLDALQRIAEALDQTLSELLAGL